MSIVRNAKLEWVAAYPHIIEPGTRLKTTGTTTRGGDYRTDTVTITFTVDTVLEMIRNDPVARERLLHHADIVRGVATLQQQADETKKAS